MVNTMMGSENTSFANISISFLRSCSDHVHECCEHDLRKGIEILAKLVISYSIIVFKMMKVLVILFIMKLITQINIFKYEKRLLQTMISKFAISTQYFHSRKWNLNKKKRQWKFSHSNGLCDHIPYERRLVSIVSSFHYFLCNLKLLFILKTLIMVLTQSQYENMSKEELIQELTYINSRFVNSRCETKWLVW